MEEDLDSVLDDLMDTVAPCGLGDISPDECDKLLAGAGSKFNPTTGGVEAVPDSVNEMDVDDVDWEAIFAADGLDPSSPSLNPTPVSNASNDDEAHEDWLPWRAPPSPHAKAAGASGGGGGQGRAAPAYNADASEAMQGDGLLHLRTHNQAPAARYHSPAIPPLTGKTAAGSDVLKVESSNDRADPINGSRPSPPRQSSLPSSLPPSAPPLPSGATTSHPACAPMATAKTPVGEYATVATPAGNSDDSGADTMTAVPSVPPLASVGSVLTTAGMEASPAAASVGAGMRQPPWDAEPPSQLPSHSQPLSQAGSCISETASPQHPLRAQPPLPGASQRFAPAFGTQAPQAAWPARHLPQGRAMASSGPAHAGAGSAAPPMTTCASVTAGSHPPPTMHMSHVPPHIVRAAATAAAAASMGLPPPHPAPAGLPSTSRFAPQPHSHPQPGPSPSGEPSLHSKTAEEQCLRDLIEVRPNAGHMDAAHGARRVSSAWGWGVGCGCGCAEPASRPPVRALRRCTLPAVAAASAPYHPYARARFASSGGAHPAGAGPGRAPAHLGSVPEGPSSQLGSPHQGTADAWTPLSPLQGEAAGDQALLRLSDPGNGGGGAALPARDDNPSVLHQLMSHDLELGLSELEQDLFGHPADPEAGPSGLPQSPSADAAVARHSSTGGVADAAAVPQWRPDAGADCEMDDNEEHLQLLREMLRSSGGGDDDVEGGRGGDGGSQLQGTAPQRPPSAPASMHQDPERAPPPMPAASVQASCFGAPGPQPQQAPSSTSGQTASPATAPGYGSSGPRRPGAPLPAPPGVCMLPCCRPAYGRSIAHGPPAGKQPYGAPVPGGAGSGVLHGQPQPYLPRRISRGYPPVRGQPYHRPPSAPPPGYSQQATSVPRTATPPPCPCPDCRRPPATGAVPGAAAATAHANPAMAPAPAVPPPYGTPVGGGAVPPPWAGQRMAPGQLPASTAAPPGRCMLPCCNPLAASQALPPPRPASAPLPAPATQPCMLPCCNPRAAPAPNAHAAAPAAVGGAASSAHGNGAPASGSLQLTAAMQGTPRASSPWQDAAGLPLPLPLPLPTPRAPQARGGPGRGVGGQRAVGAGEAGSGNRSVRPRYTSAAAQAHVPRMSPGVAPSGPSFPSGGSGTTSSYGGSSFSGSSAATHPANAANSGSASMLMAPSGSKPQAKPYYIGQHHVGGANAAVGGGVGGMMPPRPQAAALSMAPCPVPAPYAYHGAQPPLPAQAHAAGSSPMAPGPVPAMPQAQLQGMNPH